MRFAAITLILWAVAAPSYSSGLTRAKVPFLLDDNRIVISAAVSVDGRAKQPIRAWVDTGNTDLWISAKLVKELGLKRLSPDADTPFGRLFSVQPPDEIEVSGMVLKIPKTINTVGFESPRIGLAVPADINLPALLLGQADVRIDYTKSEIELNLDEPESHTGIKVPAQIDKTMPLVLLPTVIDGVTYQVRLDTGSTYTFLEGAVLAPLTATHPAWPKLKGALGAANMWGWPGEESTQIARIPSLNVGSVRFEQVGVEPVPPDASQPVHPGSTIGWLGGNVLKHGIVDIDYKSSLVYFDRSSYTDDDQFDTVGLTLKPTPDGQFLILGQATVNGKPATAEIKPGDRLMDVDGLEITGMSMGMVVKALAGRIGDTKHLVLNRDGHPFTVDVLVRRFLADGPGL